jgi:hypothetical protein
MKKQRFSEVRVIEVLREQITVPVANCVPIIPANKSGVPLSSLQADGVLFPLPLDMAEVQLLIGSEQ